MLPHANPNQHTLQHSKDSYVRYLPQTQPTTMVALGVTQKSPSLPRMVLVGLAKLGEI